MHRVLLSSKAAAAAGAGADPLKFAGKAQKPPNHF
jgi:hypothetical protein